MTKTTRQTVISLISRKRGQIATLLEELEDLDDYLNLTEARVRDEGKPRLTHIEVKKRFGQNKTSPWKCPRTSGLERTMDFTGDTDKKFHP